MNSGTLRRRISITGLTLMLGGLGLVFFEIQTDYLLKALGIVGHLILLICGTALSIWGLKDVVSSFWPQLGGRGYYFRLPREGLFFLVIMFVLFVGSILARSNLLIMVFSIMAGSFVVNGWLTFTMSRDASMSRELPQRVMAGESLMVTLTLENRNKWISAWLMTLRDSIRKGGTVLQPEVLFVRVPPRSHRVGSYHLTPAVRGRYEFTHLDVMTRFPLGMVERGVGRDFRHELLVYPRLGYLHPEWRRMLQHSMELVSHSRPVNGSFQDEMHRIREFRPGDDRRMIHWRTSARINELMVCEYHECRDRNLTVIVDAWLPRNPSHEEAEELERGLRFAATVCTSYLHFSRQSSLTVQLQGAEPFNWCGDTGEQHVDALLDGFALLSPAHTSTLKDVVDNLRQVQISQSRTLVISSRPEEIRQAILQSHNGSVGDLQVLGISREELAGVFEEMEESRSTLIPMEQEIFSQQRSVEPASTNGSSVSTNGSSVVGRRHA